MAHAAAFELDSETAGGGSASGGHVPAGADAVVRTNASGDGTIDSAALQFITASGFLGINKTTPGTVLDVSPPGVSGTGTARILSDNTVDVAAINYNNAYLYMTVWGHATAGTLVPGVNKAGLASFGTTSDTTANFTALLFHLLQDKPMIFAQNSAERFRLRTGGGAVFSTGIAESYREVADAATSITIADGCVRYATHTATRIVSLPALAAVPVGFRVEIKGAATTAAGVKLTITPDGSETVDGAANIEIATAYGAVILRAGTSEWGVA